MMEANRVAILLLLAAFAREVAPHWTALEMRARADPAIRREYARFSIERDEGLKLRSLPALGIALSGLSALARMADRGEAVNAD